MRCIEFHVLDDRDKAVNTEEGNRKHYDCLNECANCFAMFSASAGGKFVQYSTK